MSPATRVRLIVALLAVAVAAAVVGVVYATRQTPEQPKDSCGAKPPVPFLVQGVESPHATAVRTAFARGAARAARDLEPVARSAPRDPVVQFNFGTALFCAGYLAEAEQAYRAAKRAGRDTFYEIQADVVLHPQYFQQGYPIFEQTGRDPDLLRGVALQRAGHQHSAERAFARAARLHPESDEAQVAAAVARFDMDDLSASFSRLGPLVRRFPQSQSVRYHLGLLLAWTGQRDPAVAQFRRARSLGPKTQLGREANAFLRGLVTGGTKRTQR